MSPRARSRTAAVVLASALAILAPVASAAAESVRLTFVVETPASTPAGATLWISGNLAALGAWNGTGLPLIALSGGRYAGRLAVEPGTDLEFKITRGGWDTVEKGPGGEELANRRFHAERDDTVRVKVAAWRDQTAAPASARPHTLTGDVRPHTAFPSRFVKARDVWVWLPPGYDRDSTQRYPVLYFHDGNNVFDRATSFIGLEWGVDETADRLIRAGELRPFIAVAIANTPDRMAEYTSAADARHGGGRSADYLRFMLEELKPFVDRTYRTRTDAASTGVIGSSLGGLAALDAGLLHPEAFRLIGCVSPAVWWADQDLVKRVQSGKGAPLRIWLDIGTAEGGDAADREQSLTGARALHDALVRRGYRDGVNLHYEEVAGAQHNEAAWAARVGRLMIFLLGAPGKAPPR